MALTGKTRYRTQNRFLDSSVLVLQVEDHFLEVTCTGGHIDSEWVNRWRDARTEDLLELNKAT